MNEPVVNDLLRFALATAARQDEFAFRELGPIHLMKLLYLSDWAHSRTHGGETLTKIPWVFFHFGPWGATLDPYLKATIPAMGAVERRFPAPEDKEGFRWSFPRDQKTEQLFLMLERTLPSEAARVVARAVKDFGSSTYSLLDFVYRTPPMLVTAPRQPIDFKKAFEEYYAELGGVEPVAEVPSTLFDLSATKQRRRLEAKRKRVQEALKITESLIMEEPVLDEVFQEGTAWLDGLGGVALGPRQGQMQIDASVWDSPMRRIPGVL